MTPIEIILGVIIGISASVILNNIIKLLAKHKSPDTINKIVENIRIYCSLLNKHIDNDQFNEEQIKKAKEFGRKIWNNSAWQIGLGIVVLLCIPHKSILLIAIGTMGFILASYNIITIISFIFLIKTIHAHPDNLP